MNKIECKEENQFCDIGLPDKFLWSEQKIYL